MKRFLYLITLFSILLLSSCAFHSGVMTGNASLNDDNFRFKTIGVGTARTTQVFGIGGLRQRALVYEAKKDLYRAYPLTQGQAYANVTVDFKRSFYFIVGTTIATVTADVVEFGTPPASDNYQSLGRIIEKPNYGDSASAPAFHPDQIASLFKRKESAKIRILETIPGKPNKYLIEYIQTENGNMKVVKENEIFLTGENDRINGLDFRVGDDVNFQYSKPGADPIGKVMAIGTEVILVNSTIKSKFSSEVKLLKFSTKHMKPLGR